MQHVERNDFDEDALDPAPASHDDRPGKGANQHDWGRGESLEPGGDDEDELQPDKAPKEGP